MAASEDAKKRLATGDEIIARHLAPRLKELHASQACSPVSPEQVAMAACALHEGAWTERDLKRYLDKACGG